MREITCRGMSCSVLFCQWQHCPGTGSGSGSKTCPYIYPFFLHHIPAIKPISHSVGNGEKRPRKTLELDTIEVCALWQQMNDNQPENWVQPKEKERKDSLCVCLSCVWPQHVQSFKWIQQLYVVHVVVVGQLEWVFHKMPQCTTEIAHTQSAPIEVSMAKLIREIKLDLLQFFVLIFHEFVRNTSNFKP